MTRVARRLAAAHLAFGLLLLLGVACAAAVALGVPAGSTVQYAALVLNPGVAILGPMLAALPQSALGAWMLVLAHWLRNGHPRLRSALLVTHGLLFLAGSCVIAIGFLAVAAAERSTASGGGLLSPVAILPFVYGVPLALFALGSLLAFARIPGHRPPPR